jgi:hypothetical protein
VEEKLRHGKGVKYKEVKALKQQIDYPFEGLLNSNLYGKINAYFAGDFIVYICKSFSAMFPSFLVFFVREMIQWIRISGDEVILVKCLYYISVVIPILDSGLLGDVIDVLHLLLLDNVTRERIVLEIFSLFSDIISATSSDFNLFPSILKIHIAFLCYPSSATLFSVLSTNIITILQSTHLSAVQTISFQSFDGVQSLMTPVTNDERFYVVDLSEAE